MPILGNVMLVAGDESLVEEVWTTLEAQGIAVRGSADVYVRTYRLFGVEEARELRERAGGKATAGGRRVFIIVAPTMTTEAQNALLKTLEEPPADALFFFIVASPETLLSTVRSRAHIVRSSGIHSPLEGCPIGRGGNERGMINATHFLAAAPQERLEMLKSLLEKGDDDKRDTGEIIAFLASLERVFAEAPLDTKKREGIRAVYRARLFLGDKGALVKPLLEQVALLA